MCVRFLYLLFILLMLYANSNAVKIIDNIKWTVRNGNESISIPAKVPGGIYSDLKAAGIIGDILYRFNDVLTRWVAYDTWTYEGKLYVGDELHYEVANLVIHGADTVTYVEVNDSPVGGTNNMFVRYVFDIKPHLKAGENTIKVSFESPIEAAKRRSKLHYTAPECVPDEYHGECHANQLRKMQASFGWDWGPAFPSVGLWKPVAIEFYNHAIIRSVTTHIERMPQYWLLKIKAYVEANKNSRWSGILRADLTVEGPQKISITKDVDATVGHDGTTEAELNLTVSENMVDEWWPNGYGEQPLYDLRVSINSNGETHYKKIQIGFRTIELVEEDAATKCGNTTAGQGLTFYFKVNGYPIFMKGSNWIPAHVLPELGGDRSAVDGILQTAKDSHMTMLRVWGGGVYESDLFYQRCDQLGLLVWQDFLFACSMYPTDKDFLDTVTVEVEQNVKRLQHHPSIALWAGNNENEVALRGNWYNTQSQFDKYKKEYIKLYVDTIKPVVEALDPERKYIVSSPTNGVKSEEEGYIAENPYDSHYGDTHYYNYVGNNWDMNIYPPTRFASEYGFQSLPTLLTMKTATDEHTDYTINSDYSKHRQHSPNGYQFIENQIKMHLKLEKDNDTKVDADYEYFKKFVFYSQITQAMAMKAETEYYRQSQADWYTMGALYWQMNDVWQAPSWSGMDYQRRWKMLQYFAMAFFSPVLVSPRLLSTGDVDVYLLNDRFVPIFDAQITVDVFNWSSLIPISSKSYLAEVEPLSSKKQNIALDFWSEKNKDEIFLRFSLKADGVKSSPYNFLFPKPLKAIKGLKRPNIQLSVTQAPMTANGHTFWIDIKVDTIVLFLWLETPPILHSYFEDNGLIITTPVFRTTYVTKVDVPVKDLKEMITYQYYYEE